MYQIVSPLIGLVLMDQLLQEVKASQADSDERTLLTPRFDEKAARMARPVIPLSSEAVFARPAARTTTTGARFTTSRMGSWLLAGVVGFLLAVGAMAIGVTTHRRNQLTSTPSQATSTPPLATVADKARLEITQEFKPKIKQESRPKVEQESPKAEQEPRPSPATIYRAAAAAVPKTKKPERPVRQTVDDGRPKARLVDVLH
jgi:hypothetical protein